MLNYAVAFLLIAIIAGILGFGVLEATAAMFAKILFLIFLVLCVASLLRGKKSNN